MEFKEFKAVFQHNLAEMLQGQQVLFVTSVDKDLLWETYLESFPEGTNRVFRERREFDCSCCRHFIKQFGNVVTIKNNELVSVWNFNIEGTKFQPVIEALSTLVKSHPIQDVFITKNANFGTDRNRELLNDSTVHTWEHFYIEIPQRFVTTSHKSENAIAGECRDSKNVFQRSLEEISPDALEIVLDLISENILYKGAEWQAVLERFVSLQTEYNVLSDSHKDNFCWEQSVEVGPVISRIRNHSIGVLLQDVSNGKDVLESVRRYEKIVAPENYKRPKEIFTRKMVEDAQVEIERLGLVQSLGRRFATLSDVTVNNVLFADRNAKPIMGGGTGIFEALKQESIVKPQHFKNVQGIDIEKFLADVLPSSTKLEMLFESRHQNNLVSLIAPQDDGASTLFKWDNAFSWAYTGNITDSSMKTRVKMAGGNVEGVLRASLQWNEQGNDNNDLDLHCIEPDKNHIFFQNKTRVHRSSGVLDVDIIHPQGVAVENIAYSNLNRMPEGEYHFYVHCYSNRGGRGGFRAEIEYGGEIYEYSYDKPLRQDEEITIAKIRFSKRDGIKFIESLPHSMSNKTVWGLTTNQFQRVSLMCYSPNYWDAQHGIGHRHYLFMLADCINDERPNGFFNEYLRQEFMQYKHVFATLGSKMKVESSNNQLSGLGFSATKRNNVIVQVNGKRIYKIVF